MEKEIENLSSISQAIELLDKVESKDEIKLIKFKVSSEQLKAKDNNEREKYIASLTFANSKFDNNI